MLAQFVNYKSNQESPSDSTESYADISYYIMVITVVGVHEVEPREKSDYEKKNQRIGKGEEKTGGKIAPIGVGSNRGWRE